MNSLINTNQKILFSEKGGFEPPVVSQLRRFSKPMHSTTLPPFHINTKEYTPSG